MQEFKSDLGFVTGMFSFLTSAPLRMASVITVAIVAIGVLVHLAQAVVSNMTLLDTASSDNVQWTLTQVEVDFVDLERSIILAQQAETPNLSTVRREYDIFYSRVRVLADGQLYVSLRNEPRYNVSMIRVLGFLSETVPIIDEGGPVLEANLPQMREQMESLRSAVRSLSVAGLEVFARNADARRENVAQTLVRLAFVALALLSVLLLSALLLARMARQGFRRANVLQATSARLETIIATSLDAVIVTNRLGHILEFNGAAESIFGHKRADVVGHNIADKVIPEHLRGAHKTGMSRYLRTGQRKVVGAGRVRLEAQRANGEIFPVEFSIQSALGTEGEIFISFLRDISHMVQAERELVSARDQAVAGERTKSEFLAVMSHEIRTPLNGMLGTLALLKETELSPRQRSYLDTMETSGGLLLNHVNDVLDITKYEAGKLHADMSPTDPSMVVAGVVDTLRDLAASGGNLLEWQVVGAPIPAIATDARRLRQILINLVGNAVKFTDNGRIWVDLEWLEDVNKPPELEIRVIDTGVGIESEQIDRLFRDFETGDASYGRATGGTGLGLGIVRRLAEVLGGQIGAESTPGVGSCFWLRLPGPAMSLPVTPKVDDMGAQAASETPENIIPRRVLIVEDNEINRRVLYDMLDTDGHSVHQAADGYEGVRLAEAELFDVILMDISMPRLDGRNATRAIRVGGGKSQDARIIAVTAHALPREIEDFRAHGMDGYLSKPINRRELRQLMAETVVVSDPLSRHAHITLTAQPMGEVATTSTAAAPVTPMPHHKKEPSPMIDPEQITRLAEDLGRSTMDNFLERFFSEGELVIGSADHSSDPATLVADLHRLAGSAAVFGAVHLREALNRAEGEWKQSQNRHNLQPHLDELPKVWSDSVTALRDLAATIS